MRPAFFLIFGLLSARGLPAQTSLSGPVEALTFDAPTRSLRAVYGFAGAASFGPALLDNLELASVAPLQNYGIVFQGGKCLAVSGLGLKTISTAIIAGVTAHPDGIVWSMNGSLAVLYSRAGGWIQVIAGLPNEPTAGALEEVSSLGGALSAVAADASGKQIVVAMSGDNGAVYQFSSGQFTRLTSMAKPVSLSFSGDAQTLYALDAATSQVTAITLASHGLQSLALPGIVDPIAIQSLEDAQNRQVLYIAGGTDRILRILDVTSLQIVAEVPLSFEPTGLAAFGSGSFVLASRSQSSNPLWLFASAPQPGAYFVPAVQLRTPIRRSSAFVERPR
jgi:hypothetical protein